MGEVAGEDGRNDSWLGLHVHTSTVGVVSEDVECTSGAAVAAIVLVVELSSGSAASLASFEGRGAGGHGRGEESGDGGELHVEGGFWYLVEV